MLSFNYWYPDSTLYVQTDDTYIDYFFNVSETQGHPDILINVEPIGFTGLKIATWCPDIKYPCRK